MPSRPKVRKTRYPGIFGLHPIGEDGKPAGRPSAYKVYYRPLGGRQTTRTFDTLTEARDFQGSDEAKKPNRRRGRASLESVFVHVMETEEFAPATRALYAGTWGRYLKPMFGTTPIAAIRREDIRTWEAALRRKKVGTETISKARTLLSLLLSVALEEGKVDTHPMIGGRRSKTRASRQNGGKRKPRILTPEERERLVAASEDRYRALILLLCRVGLTPGEGYALRVGNLQLEKDPRVRVDESIEGPTKTGEGRWVPLPKDVVAALKTHLKKYEPADLVFPTEQGHRINPGNFRRRAFADAVEGAKLAPPAPVPSDLRDTAASAALEAGASLVEVQHLLGHASPTTTLRNYLHLMQSSEQRLRGILDSMD
jgi:integrase